MRGPPDAQTGAGQGARRETSNQTSAPKINADSDARLPRIARPALADPMEIPAVLDRRGEKAGTAAQRPWRQVLRVHPAAELMPLMTEAELKDLADDIKQNGLRHRIEWFNDGHGAVLVDGRNRLDALALIGWPILNDVGQLQKEYFRTVYFASDQQDYGYIATWVISTNVQRRHLTQEQKRDLIAKLLKASPEKSDRQIATLVGRDHKTVAAVRRDNEGRGEIPHVVTRTDTKGRAQPAKKAKPTREPSPAAPISRGVFLHPPLAERTPPKSEMFPKTDAAAESVVAFLREKLGGDVPQLIVLLEALEKDNGGVWYLIGKLKATP